MYPQEGYPFPGAIDGIHRAMKEAGIEKLMRGSDWPRTMIDFTYRQSIDFIRTDERLTNREKQLMLGENAARLYNLPEPNTKRGPVTLVTEG